MRRMFSDRRIRRRVERLARATLRVVMPMLLAPSLALASPLPCPDPMFRVASPDGETRRQTCTAAAAARAALSVCGLALRDAIEIWPVPAPSNAHGACLASYDCNRGRLEIVRPDLLEASLAPGDPYAALPAMAVYRSLLTHELAHAMLHQSLAGRQVALVDHEFVAHALEIDALQPEDRQKFLKAADVRWSPSRDVVTATMYGLAPRKFAVASWSFYRAAGCAPIEGILAGTYSFQQEP